MEGTVLNLCSPGDEVIVVRGKDKGKKGKVVRAFPKKGKVLVEGLNMAKRSQRPRKTSEKGQIMNIAMPIHVSNVRKAE